MRYFPTPYPFNVFGPCITKTDVSRWIKTWRGCINNFNLMLILAGSRTAEIEGISSAGATVDSRKYTALADAELLLNGPSSTARWPLPPLPAGVSPALLSYVSSKFLAIKPKVMAVGLSQFPSFPHLLLESPLYGPANCLSTGNAMERKRVEQLWKRAQAIGESLTSPLLLTECVPGGTTTALAVLTGLGFSAGDLISGSARKPPIQLKKKVVQEGLKNANLTTNALPKDLLAAIGDPFQAVAAGLLVGARSAGQSVILGGGCQMLAVLSLALSEIDKDLRSDFMDDIAIGTTSWLVEESLPMSKKKSSFLNLMTKVADHFEVKILGLSSNLDFTTSSKEVLRAYEYGHIKEGVGAGALTILAQLAGVTQKELIYSCEIAVEQLNQRLSF